MIEFKWYSVFVDDYGPGYVTAVFSDDLVEVQLLGGKPRVTVPKSQVALGWHDTHRIYDASHHGSPWYACELCSCSEHSKEASVYCPKYDETVCKEAEAKKSREYAYWKQLQRRREYEAYLDSKFDVEDLL